MWNVLRVRWSLGLFVMLAVMGCITVYAATNEKDASLRPFTVADDIGLARFDDPLLNKPPITVSPDGRFVAVRLERGLLEENRLEDELRIYDLGALRAFVNASQQSQAPRPIWSIKESTSSEGVLISGVRWLHNSRGLAFLLKDDHGRYQLMLTDLKRPEPQVLSLDSQDVMAFDMSDATHYAYAVRSTDVLKRSSEVHLAPAVVVTGRPFTSLLFPDYEAAWDDRSDLWAATGSSPHRLMLSGEGKPIVLYDEGHLSMALSPDGNTLAAALPVEDVPAEWESRYAPPYQGDAYRIRAGHLPLDANTGSTFASQYVTIDLRAGKLHSVAAAPTGASAHWVAGGIAAMAWSDDGRFLALPSTFIAHGNSQDGNNAPCLAVADIPKETVQCLEPIEPTYTKDGVPEPKYFFIDKLDFAGSSLSMHYRRYNQSKGVRVFSMATGKWKQDSDKEELTTQSALSIHQGVNDPPVLMAKDTQTQLSRVIWDPNPQLKTISVPEAVVYRWTDEAGNEWTGGLYKPADYVPGRRYPLVIQTHGFTDKFFIPSGTMPTAFAARAFAATGIVVLQVKGCPVHVSMTAEEAPCNVRGYEAAVKQLNAEGVIDPEKIGIIGFSRTCYYIMEALTTSSLRFKAASITDGLNYGYLQYLLGVDLRQDALAHEYEAVYKANPFGNGLQQWIEYSPEFKMQRVKAPLMVVGEGPASMLEMWEPYAALRYQNKPTDLILLNTKEHILTNPAVRMASQGGSVDWFRFWLQGYEDPAAAKAEQYQRWEKLCDLQRAGNPAEPLFCVSTKR